MSIVGTFSGFPLGLFNLENSGFPLGLENLLTWEVIFQPREKSDNFEQTGKVRGNPGKITQSTGKFRQFEINRTVL